MPRSLRHSRAHDYKHLVRRWRSVARKSGLQLTTYASAGGYDLIYLRTPLSKEDAERPSIYLSAGIHGDEVGATEGLLAWAEKNATIIRGSNLLLFPCLNPWGIVNNCRLDADGNDLNRCYNNDQIAQISAQKELLGARRFDLAMNLHEDYDATGLYIYEVPGPKPYWGELLARAAAPHVPVDLRKRIEGRAATAGIVRRAIKMTTMPNWPEAFILHFAHSNRVFTVETPSEFHLDDRVAAQVALITKAVSLCRKEFSLRPSPAKA